MFPPVQHLEPAVYINSGVADILHLQLCGQSHNWPSHAEAIQMLHFLDSWSSENVLFYM